MLRQKSVLELALTEISSESKQQSGRPALSRSSSSRRVLGSIRSDRNDGLSKNASVKVLQRASIIAPTIVDRRESMRSMRGQGRMSLRDMNERRHNSEAESSGRRMSDSVMDSVLNVVGASKNGLSSTLAAALTTNLISVGYLSMPYAFASAGMVLSTIGFFIVMLLAFITAGYVLEGCARASVLVNMTEKLETLVGQQSMTLEESIVVAKQKLLEILKEDGSDEDDDFEDSPSPAVPKSGDFGSMSKKSARSLQLLISSENEQRGDKEEEQAGISQSINPTFLHTTVHKVKGDSKAEFPELCRMFLGKWIAIFFVGTISLDLYGLTWGYASIFASGLADMLPITKSSHHVDISHHVDTDYRIYLGIFAAVAIPMSCMNLSDHVLVQLFFLVSRMIMVLLMIFSVVASWVSDEPHFDEYIGPATGVPLFYFPSVFLLLGTSIFSCSFQFAVPGITDVVSNKDTVLVKVFGSTCLFIFATVLVCSLVLSGYFGIEQIEPSSNLNWVTYHGGTGNIIVNDDGTTSRTDVAIWARGIAGFVTIFPSFDSLAVYPLCTISLGEILMDAWYGKTAHTEGGWKQRIIFRLLGSCPQLVGAMFVSDLSEIARYAGIFTILSYTVCPSLLSIYSRKALRAVSVPVNTIYDTPFSRDWFAWIIFILAWLCIVWIILSSVLAALGLPF
mmetsp:Transcript_2216/g.3839  ORF Transcript_2216/g.3839 Transcript_2216/m.3839 type:complete len:678 (-) Transcript_2216:250-2283(-)